MVNWSSGFEEYGWAADSKDPSSKDLWETPSQSSYSLSWIDGESEPVPTSDGNPKETIPLSAPLSAQVPAHEEIGEPTNLVFVTFSPFGGSEEDSMGHINRGWLDGSEKYGLPSNESWLPSEEEAPFLYSLGDAGAALEEFSSANINPGLSQGSTLLETVPEPPIFPNVTSFDHGSDSKRASSTDPWLRFRARRDELAGDSQNDMLEGTSAPADLPEPIRRRPRESFWEILDRTAQLATSQGPRVQPPVSFEVDVPSSDIHNPAQMASQASYVSQVQANAEEMTGSFPQVSGLEDSSLKRESESEGDPLENHPYFDNLEKKHEAFQASGSIDTDLEKSHKKIWHRQSDDVSISSKKFRKRKG